MKLIITNILFCILFTNVFANADLPMSSLINISAKQRALSQRIFKSWVYKKNNVLDAQAEKEIQLSVETFGNTLNLLIENIDDKLTKNEFVLVKSQWENYKIIINDAANNNYLATLNNCNKVLDASQKALDALIKYANNKKNSEGSTYNYGTVVSLTELCGRQRYLTQRFVMYYNLHFYNQCAVTTPAVVAANTLNAINANFNTLLIADYNTTDIYDELSTLMIEWKLIYAKYSNNINNKLINTTELFDTMNKYFAKFDKLTQLYGNLLN